MVEHLAYTERVGGSSPSPPTNPPGALRLGARRVALGLLAALAWLAADPLAAAEQAPMTFRSVNFASDNCVADCPQVIVADGVIEADTPQAFLDFAKQASQSKRLRSVIFINSPGGNVVASMEMGTEFRRLRAAVVVGATQRVAPPESRLGLHRMSLEEPGETGGGLADKRLVAILARYAARMGVDPALVWHAESQTPGTLHILTPAEIARWRLASTKF